MTAVAVQAGCPVKKIEVERLPDMTMPRAGHCTFYIDDEIVVMGGHTTGFKPTATAEYFDGDKWHQVDMAYDHDSGTAIRLSSGKVMIFGGVEKPLGIGQTFPAELYDPDTHTFEGFGCLWRKRALSSSALMGDGSVLIAGNWYRSDMIERYDGKPAFDSIKPVSTSRAKPAILLTAPDDAMVLGYWNAWGKEYADSAAIVDRLKGDPVAVPLLSQWHLMSYWWEGSSFIGDASKGDYTYLLGMQNDRGQVAIVRVHNGEFSLLPTDYPVPTVHDGEKINFCSSTLINRDIRHAYLLGYNANGRIFVLDINYALPTAALTLYYTDPSLKIALDRPVLTADGDLVLAGGIFNSNFYPTAAVFKLHTGPHAGCASHTGMPWWLWLVAGAIAALLLGGAWWLWRRRGSKDVVVTETAAIAGDEPTDADLMERIITVMETERPYLHHELKVADVADSLGVSSRYLSECIKAQRGCSFTQLVNEYRIAYAKQLLSTRPDMKISMVALETGFSNDTSFFRTFKVVTGMTPREWLATL